MWGDASIYAASEWRPFVIRRTTGGDVLRSRGGLRGALRYGTRPVTPEEVAGINLDVTPRFYDRMVITVQVPKTIQWTKAVLVRGGFGAPTTPQDGVAIEYFEEAVPHALDLSQQVVDHPLTPGNWYYYSLFLWISGQWVLGYSMDNAVPADHRWSEFLFNTVPMFYQRTDDQQAADGRNGPLRVFSRVLGYELDYSNTLADGVRDVYNVDRAPSRLLKYLGYNFGVPDEPVLGEARQRSMLQQLDDLNALRGTTLGLKGLIEAATHYPCDVTVSGNALLSVDDGDFNGGDVSQFGMSDLLATDLGWGIGHWRSTTNATILAKLEDPLNPGQFASSHVVTTAIVAKNTDPATSLLPPGGSGSMVVNGRGNDVVLVCGDVLNDTSVLYGIPVDPGGLYELSGQFVRNTWGAAAQQPPQARVVVGLLWFDATGTFRGASTGPTGPPVNDSGAWTESAVSAFAPSVASGGYDAKYALPVIWWIGVSPWPGNQTDTTVRPTTGRFVSMVSLTRFTVSGGAVAPIGPDVFLTLGVTTKKLSGAQSFLGEPGSRS
jgi:phage tail-like protein